MQHRGPRQGVSLESAALHASFLLWTISLRDIFARARITRVVPRNRRSAGHPLPGTQHRNYRKDSVRGARAPASKQCANLEQRVMTGVFAIYRSGNYSIETN